MKILRIGTRESQLAVWQATLVQTLLKNAGVSSELVFIKSEGDIDTVTPLYELGVQGVFTKTLDAALLNDRVDIAVHSMKDVPTQLAKGIRQASVLKRASYKDIFVYKDPADLERLGYANGKWSMMNSASPTNSALTSDDLPFTIGTSSIRRIAQWLNRYPGHRIENLRGNVNTRLRKVAESNWNGAVFAAAGVERIELRPQNSVDLDWMLPAPAQGAIMVVCREDDSFSFEACQPFNDEATALCAKIERDFLRTLMGGCSTPISALATTSNGSVTFKGNIISPDGKQKVEIEKACATSDAGTLGILAANELLSEPSGAKIVQDIRNAKK
ncbi:hydroxymethylbilane synthase [Chitinophagaceae bacterium LB-8]|uniref:Porphobilinogen deaminase n=1 Tax=Paraflavisolibacter caeni TaxID=2982496 RepID=A0A9X2XRT3_9BACT|nr:hydroxymethylbilane synthase [Paraflavisolibacter caeni]MCU7547654.1 hydroxymethylbilane synthase [Paraflavisolibacter caeni]